MIEFQWLTGADPTECSTHGSKSGPEGFDQTRQSWTEWVADDTRNLQLAAECLNPTKGPNTDGFLAVNDAIDEHRRRLVRRRGSSGVRVDPVPLRRTIPNFEAANPENYPGLETELRAPLEDPYVVRDGLIHCNLARCPLMRTEAFASIRAWKLHVVKTRAHALDGKNSCYFYQ
ncbi:unnamed protein product [Thelazia callipaeda]|uniref:Uncharacterized protein n=1 Tax=Thelazia callipaeda TaxID=103827 RepID=A0A0N5CT34_THECL|nr:unnamed protein product [Thelazia callipaeda]